jgi:hypothetical protein
MAIVPNDMRDTFFEGNSNYWFQINIMADYFIEGNLCWRDVWATTCHSFMVLEKYGATQQQLHASYK